MKNKYVHSIALASLALSFSASYQLVSASFSPTGDFAEKSLKAWDERSFEGNTQYELVTEGGFNVLHGYTNGQASILYREKKVDLKKTPILSWSWKVDRIYSGLDEQTRAGDDYPARLYVAAKTGFLPWDTLAINYVWASETPLGDTWTNPFTDKAKMMAVQSGDEFVGQWTMQSRNIVADFKTLYGLDIDEISGFAVMVDGDNSKAEANAWFGKVNFSAAME